ncbi:hypothetical protein C5167_045534 [Papaver somniferum]|uniref:Ribosomal protein L19 n=1 Tax=Papaver somniferum TaxID=3469 RepID=A0A4Y7LEU9_PAPSO|nr:hypothetical protein C5167_045534 [Papaver somniferum]
MANSRMWLETNLPKMAKVRTSNATLSMVFMIKETKFSSRSESSACHCHNCTSSIPMLCRSHGVGISRCSAFGFTSRSMTTDACFVEPVSSSNNDIAPPLQAVKEHRHFPDIQPGYTVQLKVEVPENKRRVSTLKGTVIARRNAGLHSAFRIRRMVAGVAIESLFHLSSSPSLKEMQVLNKNKTRRAKPYYLRDRKNALKKQ